MDLETENRLAAMLLEEARRLRLQADREGVGVYLHQPNVRTRPNSRFLTATVLGVQQANRVVEVSEMWRAREKELELEAKRKNRSKDRSIHRGKKRHRDPSSSSKQDRWNSTTSSIPNKSDYGCYSDDSCGLRDEEVEEFLNSRVKRGRGAVGSRMDEPGPYLSSSSDHKGDLLPSPDMRVKEEWERQVLGPEKPFFMKSNSPDDACANKALVIDASTSKQHLRSKDKREEMGKEEKSPRKNKSKRRKQQHHHHHHRSRSEQPDS